MNSCKYCLKHLVSDRSRKSHESRCPLNENRVVASTWSAEQRASWSNKCKITECNNKDKIRTEETRKAHSARSIKANAEYWTEETRLKQSIKMQDAVKNNPDSYTKNNVSGRVKLVEVIDGFGNLTKVKGSWEYNVAVWLNDHSVKWINDIEPIPYVWNNREHKYFPDFYISEFDYYIEVKGFETDRDHCKWNAMTKPLMIIREKEHRDLDNVLNKFICTRNNG